ncbi:26704_t:CDS:2 [Gigaspora margarita]|uniref:26704_t:CDS:1 n=1 Tax=Gigaspora margarita TaxID=4874 RepID=A0ABN7VJN8_GIGMA|nr:26704_t:CDS:2 [Gigaspora margarita]
MTSVTLVFGEDPYDKNFSVEISTSNNVNTLKKAINDDLKSGYWSGNENNLQKISDYFSAQPVDTNLHTSSRATSYFKKIEFRILISFLIQNTCPILNGRPFEKLVHPLLFTISSLANSLVILIVRISKYLPIFLLWIDDLIYAVTDRYVEEEERNQKMRIMFSDKLGTVSVIEYV